MSEQRSTVWIYGLERWEKFDCTEEFSRDDYESWGSLVTPWGIVRFIANSDSEITHTRFEIVQNGALHRLDLDLKLSEKRIETRALEFAQRVGTGSL